MLLSVFLEVDLRYISAVPMKPVVAFKLLLGMIFREWPLAA